jgi:hypothetical protein
MVCFQNSTELEQYKKTDMVKNMFFVGPEGETLDVDGSVVGKEKDMRENPRTRKGIEETRDKISKQRKLDSDKEKQEKFTKLKKVWDDLSKSPKGKKENNYKERYSSSSSCSSSTSVAVSSSAKSKASTSVAISSTAKSKVSASEAAEVVSQTVREESVERVVLSSSLDEVRVLLLALQHTQVWLNIGGVKYKTSQVTLRNDPASLFSIMLLPNSLFQPIENVFFFDRDPSLFRIILEYLRNNCCMKKRILPHEPKYLYELITEPRFYKLFGLVALLEERIKDLCLCKLAVD